MILFGPFGDNVICRSAIWRYIIQLIRLVSPSKLVNAMPNRSDTLSNLDRISHITDVHPRKPLADNDYEDQLETASEVSLDEELTKIKILTSVPSQLRSRPNGVVDNGLKQLDNLQLERIFASILVKNNVREQRAKRAEGNFKSNFADITSKPVVHSIFDAPYFKNSEFYGFYILFWLGTGFLFLQDILHNYFHAETTIFSGPVFAIFSTGLIKIAFTDLMMYLTIYFAYFIQYLCSQGWIQWYTSGWILQSVYEGLYTVFWILFVSNSVMKDQWIGRVFLVLHLFVLLMKMHSYAFYNGYLWSILRELQFSEKYLTRLQNREAELPDGYSVEYTRKLLLSSIAFSKFELLHQSGLLEQAKEKNVLEKDSYVLCGELVKFPGNVNIKNFFNYTMYPTTVYELVYPRTKKIRWKYLFEKLCALFGVIFLMLVVAEHSIYPLVQKCNDMRTKNLSSYDKAVFFLLTLFDMIPPFMMEYLFVFHLIWDTILNAVAEVSQFADRDFYGPWWSCTDWSEYSRLWNKPVHRFLLRHVYHSSISALNVSKLWATLLTFTISSIVHELVMYTIFGRLRGYLFYFQMGQIPLVLLSRSRFMRGKKVLGNVICWFGFVSGPAIICTLYLVY